MHKEPDAEQRIAQDLLAAGLRPGGVALVHSSLSALGRVPGGAETVIGGLLAALGPQGTLLMPALSYEHAKTFRTHPGTLRSICPTHSVCGFGPLAGELLGEHHLDDTPCGPRSPFRRLPAAGGQIVFLGCGLRPNTSMHSVEEVVVPPYLFGMMIEYDVILPDGSHRTQHCRSHDFRGWRQRYDRIGGLLDKDSLKTGMVMAALTHVIEARVMWEAALAAYGRDALFFVEPR